MPDAMGISIVGEALGVARACHGLVLHSDSLPNEPEPWLWSGQVRAVKIFGSIFSFSCEGDKG